MIHTHTGGGTVVPIHLGPSLAGETTQLEVHRCPWCRELFDMIVTRGVATGMIRHTRVPRMGDDPWPWVDALGYHVMTRYCSKSCMQAAAVDRAVAR